MRKLEHPVHVMAARRYVREGPQSPTGPTDVYVVWNPVDFRREVHMVAWYAGYDTVAEHRIVPLSPANVNDLVLLDIDGDGRREVITLDAGINTPYVVILDFGRAQGEETVLEGLPGPRAEEWKFVDLDADGRYECVARTRGRYLSRHDDANQFPVLTEDERAYLIYHWAGHEYVLSGVVRKDPTEPLGRESR